MPLCGSGCHEVPVAVAVRNLSVSACRQPVVASYSRRVFDVSWSASFLVAAQGVPVASKSLTVIAFKEGVLSADSAVFHGDYSFAKVEKITRLSDGSLYAGSGRAALCDAVKKWLDGGMVAGERPEPPKDEEDFGALWLRADGLWRISGDIRPHPDLVPFAAEGSHCEFVCGAMAAGLSAEEAVRLACRYGAWAREPVMVMRL